MALEFRAEAARPRTDIRREFSVPVPGPGTRDYKVLAERLIAEADAALYRAKSAGRNRYATSPNVVA